MIQEIMIINNAGIALFYHSFIDEKKTNDHQSLAGYFDIICKFTKNSFKESLRMLTLDSFIFFFFTHSTKYHLVLKCSNQKINRSLLEDIAESILNTFLFLFKDTLVNFDGEISHFKSFSNTIEELVTSKLKGYKEPIFIESQ